jgi:GMP reductase
MRIIEDVKLDFNDVLIKPKRSTLTTRKDADLTRRFTFRHSKNDWRGVPIIAANMDHTGTYEMHKALREYDMLTALCKFVEYTYQTPSDLIQTIGLDTNLDTIPESKWICLDVANGYTERFMEFVEKIRGHSKTRDSILIAGNVCTPEATEQIILAGADIVKIGIGPGSVCTTRKMTGVGYPQLSATIECADAAHGLGGHIITDGGCQVVGDIAKSFGAGADFVMLGGMFAGHDECEGEVENGKMSFYGMSSEDAQLKHYGKKASHRASEGKKVYIDHKGSVRTTVEEILGGLRSACTYAGAKTLKDLPKCTTFVKVNRQLNEVFS